MLCENCQLNEAELKVKVTSKNKTEEKWCVKLVLRGTIRGIKLMNNLNIKNIKIISKKHLLLQILQHLATKHGINFQEVAFKEEKRCPSCHMTLKDIAHVGKFGCANCYATFKDDIIDIVRRVQGGQFEHVGKTPHSSHKR